MVARLPTATSTSSSSSHHKSQPCILGKYVGLVFFLAASAANFGVALVSPSLHLQRDGSLSLALLSAALEPASIPPRPTLPASQPRHRHKKTPSATFFFLPSTICLILNFLGFLLLGCMDSQGPLRGAGIGKPNGATCTIPPAVDTEFRAQRPSIPPTPFFHGFAVVGSQMPFLFPHSFMPLVRGVLSCER